MGSERVFSNHTTSLNDDKGDWIEAYAEKKMDWEEFVQIELTAELLEKADHTPLYQYFVNYLFYTWEGRDPKDEVYKDYVISETDIEDLIKKVAKAFTDNGMPSGKCSKKEVRRMLTSEWDRNWDNFEKKATERVFDLGLGLGLPVEDVEELLQKAVKRAGFNFYDRDELLIYCVLRFCDHDHYHCYLALIRDYNALELLAEVNQSDSFSNTVEIRDRMNNIIENKIEGCRLYPDDKYEQGTLDPALQEFFALHKSTLPDGRTAAKVFVQLYNSFIERHREALLSYKASDRGVSTWGDTYARTTLTITYDASQEILLPGKSIFYAEKEVGTGRKGEKEKIRKEFIMEEERKLPFQEIIEVMIPVQGKEKQEIKPSKKATPGYAKKGMEMQLGDAAKKAGIVSANTATTLKYVGKAGEKQYACGEICVRCPGGTEIQSGTVFFIDGFEYETRKTCVAWATAEIPVCAMVTSAVDKIVAETGEIRYMENKPKGILSITNKKPVQRKTVTDTISKELFRQYLYGSEKELTESQYSEQNVPLPGIWFTNTEITSVRFSNILKQAGKEDNIKRQKMEKSFVRRCDIITLAFLNFCLDDDEIEDLYPKNRYEAIYTDFIYEINDYLNQCRMIPFYLANPYEYLLAYLITTDTPVDSLRNLWRIVNAEQKRTEGNTTE